MTWPTRLSRIAAIIPAAIRGKPVAGTPPTGMKNPRAPSCPAQSTRNGPGLVGKASSAPDLTARAVRVCNRDPALIERYLRVHQILGNKPSSEPENGQ